MNPLTRPRLPALLAALFLAAACGGSAQQGAEGGESTVRVGAIPGAQDLAMFVMERQGFAEEHGLDMEVETFQNPPALHTALAEKSVDIGFGGITAVATARTEGKGTFIFDMLTAPSNVVFAPQGSDVESLADLRGKKLGIFGGPSSATFGITNAVAQSVHGVDLTEDTELVTAPNPALLGLLDRGDVDAALVGTTATVRALLSGKYQEVADVAAEYEQQFGGLPGHVTVASNDEFAAESAEALTAFSAALSDSLAYIESNPQVWEDFAKDIEITDPQAPDLLAKRLGGRYIQEWGEEQVQVETELLENLIQVYGEQEFISEVPEGLFRTDFQPNP